MSKKNKKRTIKFGKHKGETIRSVIAADPGYIKWAIENTSFRLNSDETRRLNAKWESIHGKPAVITIELASRTVYDGQNPTLRGKTLWDIRTGDLKRVVAKECPHLAEAVQVMLEHRRLCVREREKRREWFRFHAPIFQTDDI